jgi:N-acetylglucosaminyl-diphospho-decaprenol L-rhamnosyltransferase
MSTTVALVNWNSGNLLRICIQSLLNTSPSLEILVVDNASEDDSLSRVLDFRNRVSFIRNSVNRGFGPAVNQAFHATTSSYVMILNPDTEALENSISLLEQFLDSHSKAGAVGGYVNDKYLPRDLPTVGRLIRENIGVPRRSRLQLAGEPVLVEQPAAAALLVRRDAFDEIGGFDEQFYPAWYEDVDFCRRLHTAGWETYFAPRAEFLHSGGYSAANLGTEKFARAYYGNQIRYVRKHMGTSAALIVRASIAAGLAARMVTRPQKARSYGKVLWQVIRGT